jgi:hypothetical protein
MVPPMQFVLDSENTMNDHDRSNLQFLLNASEDVLKDWYDSVDEDDHEYASELLARYGEELKLRTTFITCETVDSIDDAQQYLKKFSLR